ncbi:14416_t:CDS:2, partial [Funneliformis mosseae]
TGFLLVPAFLDSEIGPASLDSGFLGPIPQKQNVESYPKRTHKTTQETQHRNEKMWKVKMRVFQKRSHKKLRKTKKCRKDMEALNATFVPASEENEVIPAVD